MALNLLPITTDKMKRQSIKRLRKIAGWDYKLLSNILSQKFSSGGPRNTIAIYRDAKMMQPKTM
jgi:hypothetical protein